MVRPARLIFALFLGTAVLGAPPLIEEASAQSQDNWQYHMAQANNFYRNRLLPKALDSLKKVVADPEGMKVLKAWQLMAEIATKLQDLDALFEALEGGLEQSKGQEKAQMQAQLYRLKRTYGRIIYEVEGGSGKISSSSVKIKALDEIEDPAAKQYYEKARLTYEKVGFSKGSYYLPAGRYEIDGEEVTVTGGKELRIEVPPTTWVTFGIEAQGLVGARLGPSRGGGGENFAGGVHVGLGPHIQFASGNSLHINAGPVAVFGAQGTPDIAQDIYGALNTAALQVGGIVQASLEFRIGAVDLSPRVGYMLAYLPNGLYYSGEVNSSVSDETPSSAIDGHFVVPALAHVPRFGVDVLLTPAIVKGKRRPRLFVGFNGGPAILQPLWGGLDGTSTVSPSSSAGVRDGATVTGQIREDSGELIGSDTSYTIRKFPDDANAVRVYADIHLTFGVQLRL